MLTLLKKVKKKRGRHHVLRAPNRPHALHRLHRRAAATATVDDIFMTEASKEDTSVEEAMEEAMRELLEELNEDRCLQKLLCHLQERPQKTLTPGEGILAGLLPAEASGCSGRFPKCSLQTEELTEAFSYMWPLYNAVQ